MNSFKLLTWIVETFKRLSTKSPAYFKVWNIINILLVVIGLVPDALDFFDITLPADQKWAKVLGKFMIACGSYGYLNSKLSVDRSVVTKSGVILIPENSKGEEKKPVTLPYTDKLENKKVMTKIENAETIQVAQKVPAVEIKGPDL